ncbi:MAG: ABC transporter ATP-binding protein [Bacillota bacterium]|nr:ABC transporter ATP-binding protein [Bacillota bacterium]
MRPLLTVRSLAAGYGDFDVLEDVSFELYEGEKLVVLGANGCGKTTLIRAVSGLIPSRGEVRVLGDPLERLSTRERARRLAVLGQLSAQWFSFTVEETVRLGRYAHRSGLFGSESRAEDEVVARSLAAVGLTDLARRPITELSGGQLQRVFLARTFAQEPSIILLDEPTNHLDLRYQEELQLYLDRWVKEPGRAICGVLHDLGLAADFADRILILAEGRVLAMGSWARAATDRNLEEAFGINVVHLMRRRYAHWGGER